jgi:hypothetical protein
VSNVDNSLKTVDRMLRTVDKHWGIVEIVAETVDSWPRGKNGDSTI